MLKTVSYLTLGFPEYGMANASNFTRGFTPASNPERGNTIWATEVAFIYVKRPKPKNSVISYLRVPTVRNGQCKQFYGGFTPASNPERGNNTLATKWAFIYVMKAEPKNSVIAYLRVPRIRNYIWVGVTKSSKTPRVKPRVRNDQCK